MAEANVAEQILNATVTERHEFSEVLSYFRITPDSGQVPQFKPGQFCTIGLPPIDAPAAPANPDKPRRRPKLTRRAYSIASSPNVRDHLELLIVLVDEGKLTPELWKFRQTGDRLYLDDRIMGEFTLDGVPDGKDLIWISTGTGLAPYISMLRTFQGTGRWRKVVTIHGCRYTADLGYRQELETAAANDPSVVYLPMVTREPDHSDWTGLRGRVTALFERDDVEDVLTMPLDPEQCHVFLCGSPDMINQMQALLEARGFVTQTKKQPGNIHFERYW